MTAAVTVLPFVFNVSDKSELRLEAEGEWQQLCPKAKACETRSTFLLREVENNSHCPHKMGNLCAQRPAQEGTPSPRRSFPAWLKQARRGGTSGYLEVVDLGCCFGAPGFRRPGSEALMTLHAGRLAQPGSAALPYTPITCMQGSLSRSDGDSQICTPAWSRRSAD